MNIGILREYTHFVFKQNVTRSVDVQHSAKQFAEKLNQLLDDMDVPNGIRERSVIFSKMLNIPKQQGWALLEGQIIPDQDLLSKIAAELDASRLVI